jgi:hypothetical protein
MARENRGWGYDRIVGALASFGYKLSHRTVGSILCRNNIAPAPKRVETTDWTEFIRSHVNVLAGTDFHSVEVLTWRALVTCYCCFSLRSDAGGSVWAASHITRTENGCSKWPETPPWKILGI